MGDAHILLDVHETPKLLRYPVRGCLAGAVFHAIAASKRCIPDMSVFALVRPCRSQRYAGETVIYFL